MPCFRHPFSVLRALAVLVLFCTAALVCGQQNENDLVYKFKVQGIEEPAMAKSVQVVLLQEATTTSCVFIDESDDFKLASSSPLTHAALKTLLLANGHALFGPVYVSDGTVLMAPTAPAPTQ